MPRKSAGSGVAICGARTVPQPRRESRFESRSTRFARTSGFLSSLPLNPARWWTNSAIRGSISGSSLPKTEIGFSGCGEEPEAALICVLLNSLTDLRQIALGSTLRRCQLFAGLPPNDLDNIVAITVVKSFDKGEYVFHEGAPSHGFYVVQKGAINVHRVSLHLRVLVAQIEDLTLKDVETRLANWLVKRCPNPDGQQPVTIQLKTTKRVLAAELGTVSETFSRSLAKFRDLNLLSVNGKSMTVLNPAQLSALLRRHLGE